MDDDAAPGWDAIATAARGLAASDEPVHFGSGLLPGQDGLYGLDAYPLPDAWILLTLGLTELFGKESDQPDVSGWGFELTLRVPRGPDDDQPPEWAVALLNRLGKYVFSARSPFATGHRLDPGGPITGRPDTRLTAVAFTDDPDLSSIDTPNGRVHFLRVVGVTDAELEEMQRTATARVIERLAVEDATLTTDPTR